jgi:hypothetical protein
MAKPRRECLKDLIPFEFQRMMIKEEHGGQNLASCDYCQKSGSDLQKCSGCKIAFYCSREHQKKAWGEHKIQCSGSTASLLGKKSLPGSPMPGTWPKTP